MDNLNIYYNRTFNSMTDFVDFFMDKAKLYIKVKPSPNKIIIKYSLAAPNNSDGILNKSNNKFMDIREITINIKVIPPINIKEVIDISLNLSFSLEP